METRWGKRFGRYEIIAELGRGAMGVVYKARDPKIDRFVAVKTISLSGQNPEEEREYRERFFHEAQAAGRLLHPGIVTIFDTGEDPESHIAYIVMEYIPGQSLDQLLSENNRKLPLETALLLTEELAEALDHAHAQGVVHRDMKPANILMTNDGHGKIADFGVAKLNLAQLTLPGRALGTPAYMSPEDAPTCFRWAPSSIGCLPATDLFKAQCYHCFLKVVNRDPLRTTSFDSNLPLELDAVVVRAMAKDPAQRYQRGLEFALDLRELRERCPANSKGANSVSQFSKTRQVFAWSDGNATISIPSENWLPVGFFNTQIHAARRALSSVPREVLSCWRITAVRQGLVLSVATILFGLLIYHRSQPSQNSTRTGTPADVVRAEGSLRH